MATVAGCYLANWPATVAGAFVGYTIDRSHGEPLEWDGLGGLIYGSFAGLVVAHVFWAVVVWRTLRPQSPRSDVGIVIALVPLLIVAVAATTRLARAVTSIGVLAVFPVMLPRVRLPRPSRKTLLA